MSKLIVFDDNSKCFTDSETLTIQPVGTTPISEVNLDDFTDQEKQQIRANLHNEAKLNQMLQKRGKHISMKLKDQK